MKKKLLFLITNVLLVALIALIIGLACKENYATAVGTGAYVCLLITLCIPSVLYFFAAQAGTPLIVINLLLMLGEMALNITCLALPQTDIKVFAITQGCLVGAYLIAMLVFIALSDKKETAE